MLVIISLPDLSATSVHRLEAEYVIVDRDLIEKEELLDETCDKNPFYAEQFYLNTIDLQALFLWCVLHADGAPKWTRVVLAERDTEAFRLSDITHKNLQQWCPSVINGRKVRIGELLHQRIDNNNRSLLQQHLNNYQARLKEMFPAEKLNDVSGRYKELLALTADDFVSH